MGHHQAEREPAELLEEPGHEIEAVPGDEVGTGAVEGVAGDLVVLGWRLAARRLLGVGPVRPQSARNGLEVVAVELGNCSVQKASWSMAEITMSWSHSLSPSLDAVVVVVVVSSAVGGRRGLVGLSRVVVVAATTAGREESQYDNWKKPSPAHGESQAHPGGRVHPLFHFGPTAAGAHATLDPCAHSCTAARCSTARGARPGCCRHRDRRRPDRRGRPGTRRRQRRRLHRQDAPARPVRLPRPRDHEPHRHVEAGPDAVLVPVLRRGQEPAGHARDGHHDGSRRVGRRPRREAGRRRTAWCRGRGCRSRCRC